MSKQQSNKSGAVYRIADRACRILQWLWLIFLGGICIGFLANIASTGQDPTKLVGTYYSITIGPVQLGPTLLIILVALILLTMVFFFLRDRYKPDPDKKIQDVIESIHNLMKKEEELVNQETDPLTRMLEQQRIMTQEQQSTSSLLAKWLEQQRIMTQEQQSTSSLLTKWLEQQNEGVTALLQRMQSDIEQEKVFAHETRRQLSDSLLIKDDQQ